MRATTVGFSGSGASRRALRWAVQDSAATGWPLHVVLGPDAGHHDLDAVLAEELLRVPGREPAVDVTLTTGSVARALLTADSVQLVLGCGRDVAPLGVGGGQVLGLVVPRSRAPVVLVGPRAVLTPPRRVLVVCADRADGADGADEAVVARALDRDLPLRLLTTWSADPASGEAGRRHAHLLAAARHHALRAGLSAGTHRPVRAEVVEGRFEDVLPRRVSVGDLLLVTADVVDALPVRTLRSPVVLVPAAAPAAIDLRETSGARETVPVG